MDSGLRDIQVKDHAKYQVIRPADNYWPNPRFKDATPASHQERGIVTLEFARAIPCGEMRHPDGQIRRLASMDEFHSDDRAPAEWIRLRSGNLVRMGDVLGAADPSQVPVYSPAGTLGVVGMALLAIAGTVLTGMLFAIGTRMVPIRTMKR
jgi:hypothetical protein